MTEDQFLSEYEILAIIADTTDSDVYKASITGFNVANAKAMLTAVCATELKKNPKNAHFTAAKQVLSDGPGSREKFLELIRNGHIDASHDIWTKPVQFNKTKNFLSDAAKRKQTYRQKGSAGPLSQQLEALHLRMNEGDGPDTIQKSTNFKNIIQKHLSPGSELTRPQVVELEKTVPTSIQKASDSKQSLPQNFAFKFNGLIDSVSLLQVKIDDQAQTIAEATRTEFKKFWTEDQLGIFTTQIMNQMEDDASFNGLVDRKIAAKFDKLELDDDVKKMVEKQIEAIKEQLMKDFSMRMHQVEKRVEKTESTIATVETRIEEGENNTRVLNEKIDSFEPFENFGTRNGSGKESLSDYEVEQAYAEFVSMAKEYSRATFVAQREGLVTIIIMEKSFYSKNQDNKVTMNQTMVENELGFKLAIFGDPTISRKNKYPIFEAKLTADAEGNRLNLFKMKRFMNKRINFKGKLVVKISAPPRFSIKPVTDMLMDREIILDSIDTKNGKICIYINDGNKTILEPYTTGYKEYRDSCSFFIPAHPMLLVRLREPSIDKLRAIARSEHFIHPSFGVLVRKPKKHYGQNNNNKPEHRFENISNFHTDQENFDEQLKKFLMSNNFV